MTKKLHHLNQHKILSSYITLKVVLKKKIFITFLRVFDHQFFRIFFKLVLKHKFQSKFEISKTQTIANLILNKMIKHFFNNIANIFRKSPKYDFTFIPF